MLASGAAGDVDLAAFEAVRDAFELSDQRRQARKERKKAKEMLKQGAADGNVQEGQSNAGEEKMDVVVEPTGGGENETQVQDDNASASSSQDEKVLSAASLSVDADVHEPVEEGERSSRAEVDDDDTDEPPKKRPRTE